MENDTPPKKSPAYKAGPGRPPGSVNKYNLLAGKHLEARGVNLVDDFLKSLAQIQNQEAKASLILKAMVYVYPQLSAIAVQNIPNDVKQENGMLSNEELFAKAKLIMERNQNDTRTITNGMEPTSHSTGGDSNSTRSTLTVRTRNQAEDGEDQ